MKPYYTLLVLLLSLTACKKEATEPEPASTSKGLAFGVNSTGQTYGKAIAADASDNFIVATLFQGSMPKQNITAVGTVDTHIAKYDKNGTLLWERTAGGTNTSTIPNSIDTDAQGNIYVTGYFGADGNATGRSAKFGDKTITTKSGYDAFLAKYDPNGTLLWVFGLGNTTGATEERGLDLTIDGGNNIYLTGAFSGTIDFNPLGQARVLMAGETTSSLFLAKYNADGQNLLASFMAANLTDVANEAFAGLDMDIYGNVIWSGNFRDQGRYSFATLQSAGQADIFVGCFRTWDLGINWIQRFGGTGQDLVSLGAMRVNARSIVLTGRFAGTMSIGNTQLTSQSTGNVFVAAYSPDSPFQWAIALPGATGISSGYRVGFDASDNVYVAGSFRGMVNFNPKASNSLTANGTNDAGDLFLAKYGYDGSYLWAKGFGATLTGSDNLAVAAGLATDKSGNALITGKFYGKSVDFDPSDLTAYLTSIGQDDGFVAKYTSEGALWSK